MKPNHHSASVALTGLIAAGLSAGAIAATVQTTSARFELVLPGYSPDKAVEAAHKAYSGYISSAQKSIRFLPNPMPIQPGTPLQQAKYAGGVSVPDMNCDSAYAEITYSPKATSNAVLGGGSGEVFRGCLYAFQKGFKLYGLVTTYESSTDGISASIIGGIGKLVQGGQGTNVERQTTRLLDKLRDQAPDMLVARLEYPGKAVQEPDATAVAELIPAALPTPAATPITQTAASSADAQIEARKSLTGMGLVYHDQAQFLSAIRRKDELAVKLFVAGGGVDLAEPDANGQTPLALAKATGSASIIGLIDGTARPVQPVELKAKSPTPFEAAMNPDSAAMQARMREMIQRQQLLMQGR